jgi:hypothetical protein
MRKVIRQRGMPGKTGPAGQESSSPWSQSQIREPGHQGVVVERIRCMEIGVQELFENRQKP